MSPFPAAPPARTPGTAAGRGGERDATMRTVLQYRSPAPPTPKRIGVAVAYTLAAFVAGALAWVLPPHALGGIVSSYAETSWKWLGDGVNNAVLSVSIPAIVGVGFAYGLLLPRRWYLSFFATWWVLPLNITLDVTRYPTSHNLFPFELIVFAVLNAPTLAGAVCGRLVRRRGTRG